MEENNQTPFTDSTKKLLAPLRDLGLNTYEAKVYLSLITEGITTAKNVADITGIPYGKVYEVINMLMNRGFCLTLPAKPMKYQAISPKLALAKTREHFEKRFSNIERRITRNVEPFYQRTKEFSKPSGVCWVINGRANAQRKIDELIAGAQHSISILATENGVKRLVIHHEELLNAKKRNITIKIAGPMTSDNAEDAQSISFCEVRNASKVPTQLIVIDGKESLIVEAVPDDDNIIYGRDVGIWITNAAVTTLLEDTVLAKHESAIQAPVHYPPQENKKTIITHE